MSAPSNLALIALLLAGLMVGGAQFMEHVLGLEPCALCLMQRLWTVFGGAAVLAGLAYDPRSRGFPITALACTTVGAGFSVRQLWLQSLPPDAVPACGPDMAYMIDAFPLSEILRTMTLGTGNCAKVDWSLFGISIAGYALVGFIVLAGILCGWIATARRPTNG